MGRRIELIARGMCVEGGKLLVCVNERHGYGYLPGGHVEFGESATAALAREFVEECGVEVACALPVLGLELAFEQGGKRRHEVSIVFPVKRQGAREQVTSLEPGIRFEWWPIMSLHVRDLRPSAMRTWLATKLAPSSHPPTTMEWVSAMGSSHNP